MSKEELLDNRGVLSSTKRKAISPGDENLKFSKRRITTNEDDSESSAEEEIAEEDGESIVGSEEDEDVDEDDGDYVEDGFVVKDDADEIHDEDEDFDFVRHNIRVHQKKKLQKLKKQKENIRLDQEDIDLIQHNIEDEGFGRDQHGNGNSSEIASIHSESGDRNFTGGEISPENRDPVSYRHEDGSDLDDFIEEDEAEDGEVSDPEHNNKNKNSVKNDAKSQRLATGRNSEANRNITGLNDDQIQEALGIFGPGYDDIDEEDEDELSTARDAAVVNKSESEKNQVQNFNSTSQLRLRYDVSQLVAEFYTECDEKIRSIDLPERLQEIMHGRSELNLDEREREADWISVQLKLFLVHNEGLTDEILYSLYDISLESLKDALYPSVLKILHFLQVS